MNLCPKFFSLVLKKYHLVKDQEICLILKHTNLKLSQHFYSKTTLDFILIWQFKELKTFQWLELKVKDEI